jgi:hypothetical protein
MQTIIALTLFLQRRLPWCLCTCAGRRLARSSTLLKCLRSGPKDEKGKIALRTAAGRQAQANRQTSAGLALLSRKLDYTTADPPKLRPGLVSARLREQGRNGPAASQSPFVHAHPQSPCSSDLLFLTRPYSFPTNTLVPCRLFADLTFFTTQSLFTLCCLRRGILPFKPKISTQTNQTAS